MKKRKEIAEKYNVNFAEVNRTFAIVKESNVNLTFEEHCLNTKKANAFLKQGE